MQDTAGISRTASLRALSSLCRWLSARIMMTRLCRASMTTPTSSRARFSNCTAPASKAWSHRFAASSATSIPISLCSMFRRLQQQVDSNLDQQRAIAQLTGLFGLLALILAAVGPLWSHRLCSRAPHQRNWCAHGSGCKSRQCHQPCFARCFPADPYRARHRHSDLHWLLSPDRQPALSGRRDGTLLSFPCLSSPLDSAPLLPASSRRNGLHPSTR